MLDCTINKKNDLKEQQERINIRKLERLKRHDEKFI